MLRGRNKQEPNLPIFRGPHQPCVPGHIHLPCLLPYRWLVSIMFDRLQYESGGCSVTLFNQDLVDLLQLRLIYKARTHTAHEGWQPAVSIYTFNRGVCLLQANCSSLYVRSILALPRLTFGMGINDDLQVNGALGSISQGSFVCLYTKHFTF